jgi:hypothetical protein
LPKRDMSSTLATHQRKVKSPVENIQHTLSKNNYSTKVNINNYSNYSTKISKTTADRMIAEALDLISNPEFKPYFFKTLYIVGEAKFRQAMEIARTADADCRPCLFAKILKNMRYEVLPR